MKFKKLWVFCLLIVMMFSNVNFTFGDVNKKEEFTKRANTIKSDYDKEWNLWMTQSEINHGTAEYRKKWDDLLNEVYNY